MFFSSVINGESVRVSESGQNGIIMSRGGGRMECRQEVGLSMFLNNSRVWVSVRCFSDSRSA